MDLTPLLLRIAARRPHVLVVPVPGAAQVRLAVEAALARRGWPVAAAPADADVLLVAGGPGPELAAVVDAVWEQVPAPRARIEVTDPAAVDDRLDAAARAVSANQGHDMGHGTRTRSRPRDGAPAGHGDHAEHGGHEEHGQHGQHAGDGGGAGPAQHVDHAGHADHADHGAAAADDHAGHGGGHHGHHHGHGGTVAGLPMAGLGPDRDGLTLDRLHVPLGPVLPDWPAGLVVHVTMQGDVIQEASAEVLDAGPAEPFAWPSAVARELDGLARFLGVAGWPSLAGRARRLRDAALAGDGIRAEATALVRRVRRSRTLRWVLRGIPAGATDVPTLLGQRLAAIEEACGGPPALQQSHSAATRGQQSGFTAIRPTTGLGDLLVGAELAAARLIVAAVDPDTDRRAVDHG